jgi:hypothetical protein
MGCYSSRALDGLAADQEEALRTYRVEVPSDTLDEDGEVIDWLIGYTFDTLGASHLDLRVVSSAG